MVNNPSYTTTTLNRPKRIHQTHSMLTWHVNWWARIYYTKFLSWSVWDNGVGAFENSPECLEKIWKHICKVFKNNDLKRSIDVNYLDATQDLNKGTHEPYLKPSNKPLYIHNDSGHPRRIIKNIPLARDESRIFCAWINDVIQWKAGFR